jgi:hypothetical protein
MEAVHTSEKSVNLYQTEWRHIPEDCTLQLPYLVTLCAFNCDPHYGPRGKLENHNCTESERYIIFSSSALRHGGVKAFLISALDGDKWSVSRSGLLIPGEVSPGRNWLEYWEEVVPVWILWRREGESNLDSLVILPVAQHLFGAILFPVTQSIR